jgi:hypothetical protein
MRRVQQKNRFYKNTGKLRYKYVCTTKGCSGNLAAHPTGRPVGVSADATTRYARHKAHLAFDAWRAQYSISVNEAYKQLALMLGTPKEDAHMGSMDKAMCRKVEKLCQMKCQKKSTTST